MTHVPVILRLVGVRVASVSSCRTDDTANNIAAILSQHPDDVLLRRAKM